jgi:hypothetical protein
MLPSLNQNLTIPVVTAQDIPGNNTGSTAQKKQPSLAERINATFLATLSNKAASIESQLYLLQNSSSAGVLKSLQELLNLIHAEYSSSLIDTLPKVVSNIQSLFSSENYIYSQEEFLKSAYEVLNLVHAEYRVESSPTGNKQIKFTFPSPEALE